MFNIFIEKKHYVELLLGFKNSKTRFLCETLHCYILMLLKLLLLL